jgi:hypothetical protein
MRSIVRQPSELKDQAGIEYFLFEEDFVEEGVRCIPMIVRFKMDLAGIKLKLAEWVRFSVDEKKELALRRCGNPYEIALYNEYLSWLIKKHTGKTATGMEAEQSPAWADINDIPEMLNEKAKEFDWVISIEQWKGLTDLQRFALLKLCRPGHENKNFPKAVKEFGLVSGDVRRQS